MKRIKIWNDNPDDKQLADICSVLDAGGLIVYPTDTLYAIGCDALNAKAVERICRLKNINPEKSNLSIICCDIAQAANYCRIDNKYFRLIKENTPGAFTFLLRAASTLPKAFKNRKVVGIRIPDCALDLRMAEYLGRPIMTTSIEFDTDDEATSPELIADKYSVVADLMIIGNDGSTQPSTIIDCTGDEPEIIRQGAGQLI